MNYKKKLKLRLYLAITYILLGVIMIITSFIIPTNDNFVSSFGFGLIIIGFVRIRNYCLITKNEETIKKQEIAETDERNISIINKARSTTFLIYVVLSCIAVIVFAFLKMTLFTQIISTSVCLLCVIYWVSYLIYQKKL